MAVIPMPVRPPRLQGIRSGDRIERGASGRRHGLAGLFVGTAIVAGCVTGLFLYDAGRPFATGAALAPPAPLEITVEPMSAADAQPR